MRQRSLEFWANVRTANWILGALGMALWAGYTSGEHPRERDRALPAQATASAPLPARSETPLPVSPFSPPRPSNFPGRRVNSLAFTGDGRTLIGSGSNINDGVKKAEVHAWDVATGRKLWTIAPPGLFNPYAELFTLMPDGASLVTVAAIRDSAPASPDAPGSRYSLELTFRDARTGKVRHSTQAGPQRSQSLPMSIDVDPYGRSVAVASADKITVWYADKGSRLQRSRTLRRPSDRPPISRAQFTSDGRHLLVLSAEGDRPRGWESLNVLFPYADVWDARTGDRIHSFGERTTRGWGDRQYHHKAVMATLSPDRRRVVLFSARTHRFTLWDIGTGRRLAESPSVGTNSIVVAGELKFVADRGDTVAVRLAQTVQGSTPPSSFRQWDIVPNLIRQYAATNDWHPAQATALSRDGRFAATADRWHGDSLALLRDARTGESVRPLEGKGGL